MTKVTFSRVIIDDNFASPPWENEAGFWPSRDKSAPGYVPPEQFDEQQAIAEARRDAWNRGDIQGIGVVARATITIPYGRDWVELTIDSLGLWGLYSDDGDEYLMEVYEEEKSGLIAMLETLRSFEVTT